MKNNMITKLLKVLQWLPIPILNMVAAVYLLRSNDSDVIKQSAIYTHANLHGSYTAIVAGCFIAVALTQMYLYPLVCGSLLACTVLCIAIMVYWGVTIKEETDA